MSGRKTTWIVLIVVLVVAGGGYAAYRLWFAPGRSAEAPTDVQTATVTRGNLSVTASGSGQLVPSSEVELAFAASGKVLSVLVEVGDKVQAGDTLAWIDDAAARQAVAEAELLVLEAERELAVAQGEAELAVAQARVALAVAESELEDLENWGPDDEEIAMAQAQLRSAQINYQTTSAQAQMSDATNASTRISLDKAIAALANAQQAYAEAMNPERDYEKDIESTRNNAADSLVSAQQSLELAQANYDLAMIEDPSGDVQTAYANLLSARQSLEEVETPPDETDIATARNTVRELELTLARAELALGAEGASALKEAELAVEQATSALESAQEALDGTTLIAPFDGVVTAVNIEVGETAAEDAAALSMADLENPVVEFWVEESDLNSVAVGNTVDFTFTALPDYAYQGEIYRVDPVLVTVGNTAAVQCWATIDTTAHSVTLLGDMNVDVDITAGEAANALLVPVQALRDTGDAYAVFVMLPGGELEMRGVEIGLQDYVNAVVLSGLEEGDIVTLNTATATSFVATDSGEGGFGMPGDFGGPPSGGFGGGGMP